MSDETQTETAADEVQVEVPDYTGEPAESPTEDATEAAPADEPALDTSGDEAQAARYKTIGYPVGADHS